MELPQRDASEGSDAPAADVVDRRPAVPWTLVDVVVVWAVAWFVAVPLVHEVVRALVPADMAGAVAFPLAMFALAGVTAGWVRARYPGRGLAALTGARAAGVRDVLIGLGHGLAAFVVLNVVLGLLLLFLAELLGVELPVPQQAIRELADDPAHVPFLLLSVVVAAPLAEELLFRGMLFQWLRSRVPLWLSVVGSGLVFGSMHWESGSALSGAYMVLSLSLVGAWLAVLFHRRGTIVAPIVMHATFNLLAAVWIMQGLG